MVHTRVEVQEQTEVGDALVRGLVRAQLGLALRLAAVMVGEWRRCRCCNAVFPNCPPSRVFGVRLNWLILAVLVYPVLYGVGRLFIRLAEQGERDFMGVVDDESPTGDAVDGALTAGGLLAAAVATVAVGAYGVRLSRTTSDFLVASRTVGAALERRGDLG